MQLNIKRTDPNAELPSYATEGAACFDLRAIQPNTTVIAPNETRMMSTGLSFEVPAGNVMLIFARSGLATKQGLRPANCVGVIDADFRGVVTVPLHNDSDQSQMVGAGERIAQAMILPVERVTFVEVDELSATARGAGGFGSTGAA